MSIEETLKSYILSRYKSIREFVRCTDLPYTTVDGILKRGIANSSIGNVLKICKALEISADELANNKIVPINSVKNPHVFFPSIPEMIDYMRNNPDEFSDLAIDGQFLSQTEFDTLLNGIALSVEFVRLQRKKQAEEREDEIV